MAMKRTESARRPPRVGDDEGTVLEHFPSPLTTSESDDLIDAIMNGFARDGFGLWVLEGRGERFIGFTGLSVPSFEAPFTPAVEVSRAVMQRLGMTHDPSDDFEHPRLPQGHRLRRHVLYRIRAEQWIAHRDAAGLRR